MNYLLLLLIPSISYAYDISIIDSISEPTKVVIVVECNNMEQKLLVDKNKLNKDYKIIEKWTINMLESSNCLK